MSGAVISGGACIVERGSGGGGGGKHRGHLVQEARVWSSSGREIGELGGAARVREWRCVRELVFVHGILEEGGYWGGVGEGGVSVGGGASCLGGAEVCAWGWLWLREERGFLKGCMPRDDLSGWGSGCAGGVGRWDSSKGELEEEFRPDV
ncbi:hypothetical protein Tco_0102949 [Tanacetum coccineum]